MDNIGKPGQENNLAGKWKTERVLSIRHWTPALMSFRISRGDFYSTRGHYARLGLGAGDDTVWRPLAGYKLHQHTLGLNI